VEVGVGVDVAVAVGDNPVVTVGLGLAITRTVAERDKVLVGKTIVGDNVGDNVAGCTCAADRVIPPITTVIDAMAASKPIRSSRMAFMGMVSADRFLLWWEAGH
jgi:hypothetical protein